MELTQQEIRFNLLISNIQQLKDQTGELKTLIQSINKPATGDTVMKKLEKDTDSAIMKLKTYESQLSQLRQKAAQSFMVGDTAGFARAKADFDNLNTKMVEFNRQFGISNRGFYDMNNNLSYLGAKMRSHFSWLLSGSLLAGALAIPVSAFNSIKQIEQAMAGMKQVIPELHESQGALNTQTLKFVDIAATYGESIQDVIKAGQLWGRMYKDLNIVNALTHQSTILAVADNFSLVDANKALEAAMFQYGLTAKTSTEAIAYSGRIIDIWTKLAHNAGVSAQDLAQAVERTGSVARLTGVDFEFLNAMIATGVRSTGRSGAEIGSMIKSVLGSINTKKAREEIEALGIATTKVGVNGAVELRKAQDVLLDIAIQAQGTDRNLEDLFKAISGGKWQWSKTASMLGDYQEFIRTWGQAVNSTGFSASQVEMQLDTISRKIKMLVGDAEGLFVNTGNAGITKWLKDEIQGFDDFVVGLRKIPKEAWQATATLGELAMGVYIASKAFNFLATAIRGAEAATISLARRNLIILGMVGLAYAITWVVERYGALENAERNAAMRTQDAIAVKSQEIEMYKKQSEFVEALISSRQKLEEQLGKTDSAEKIVTLNNDIQATEKELTNVLGEAAVQRIKDSNWSQEAIETEKTAFIKANDVKKQELKTMISAQIAATDATIIKLEDQIKAYYEDARHFGESINAKLKSLSVWQAAMLTMQEWQTSFHEGRRDQSQKMLDNFPDTPANSSTRAMYQQNIDEANVAIANSQKKGAEIAQTKLKELQSQLSETIKSRVALGNTLINFSPAGVGGDEFHPKGPKDTNGSRNLNALGNMQDHRLMNDAVAIAKVSLDQYQESLDNVNFKEKLYGKSIAVSVEMINLKVQRQKELTNEQNTYNSLAEIYKKEAQGLIDKDGGLSEDMRNYKISLADLGKAEFKELMRDNQALQLKIDLYNKSIELAAKAKRDSSKMGNEATLEQFGNTQQHDYQSQRNSERISNQEKIGLAGVNPYGGMAYLDELRIKLAAAQQQLQQIASDQAWAELQLKQATTAAAVDYWSQQVDKLKVNYAETTKKIADYTYDMSVRTKEFYASTLGEILVEQKDFGSIISSIWKKIAMEAINSMMGIKQASSILSTIGGKGKGGKGGAGLGVSGPTMTYDPTGMFLIPKGVAHNGGVVGSLPKFHNGGVVPYLKNDELPTVLQSGEEVNSKSERRTIEMLTETMKAMSANSGSTQIVIHAIDSKSFVEFADAHGDALVNILRKQGSMGNRL